MTTNVGKSTLASLKEIGQSLVIEPEQGQHGSVKVIHVHFIFDGMEAEVIRCADNLSAPDSATSHPHAEAVGMVVPSVGSLPDRRASELTTPNNQRAVKETSLVQIGK